MTPTKDKSTPNLDKVITNPRFIGPGVWWCIHTKGKLATTDQRKEEFEEFMNILADNFSCLECRNHMKEYYKANDIRSYFNMKDKDGKDIGCFKWTWLFHNAVNKRIHRYILPWESAVDMYYGEDSVCNSGCGSEKEIDEDMKDMKDMKINEAQVSKRESKTNGNRKVEIIKVSQKKKPTNFKII